jgi:hypothetical protein
MPVRARKRRPRASPDSEVPTDDLRAPYMQMWLALTPAQRLRRSWRLRRFLKDPKAVHDAKTFPRL